MAKTWDSTIFYTHKNLISTILIIFLLKFDIFTHNLGTITCQDTTNLISIVLYKFCIVITFVSHMGSHTMSIICTVLYLILK